MRRSDPRPSHMAYEGHVPNTFRQAALLTGCWLTPMLFLLLWPMLPLPSIPYACYYAARHGAVFVLLCLAALGVWRAGRLAGSESSAPWYTSAALVALTLFWALFPPSWFFLEYFLLDAEAIALPPDVVVEIELAGRPAEAKAAFLATTKTYADMSAKIWASVGVSLATAVALAKRA
jgi:hypothetical protein